jgi:hypothetical protein
MPQSVSSKVNPVPIWLVVPGSILIAGHLLALVVLVIAAPSGPWSTNFGPDMALQPWFAGKLNEITTPYYLQPLKLTHNYHFMTNRTGTSGVYFEAKVKDDSGKELATLKFPDDNANFWVRHRQAILARSLGDDQIVQAQMGESVAAPNQQVKTVKIWVPVEGKQRQVKLKEVPEHLTREYMRPDGPLYRTSDWTHLLINSYARHLGRVHDAAAVEFIRHNQDPIPPVAMMVDLPAGMYDELVSNFGNTPTSTPKK